MKAWILLGCMPVLMLSGCDDPNMAQNDLDAAKLLCRDGVEYMMVGKETSRVLSPHLQRDGKPYPCGKDIQAVIRPPGISVETNTNTTAPAPAPTDAPVS